MSKLLPISLCMIVKNEEEFIGNSLTSAKKAMNFTDIIVADTGSTDKTKEIATELRATVCDFTWVNDFSAARNFAAKEAKNDWILMIDADEDIVDADISAIHTLLQDEYNIGIISRIELPDGDITTVSRLYNRKRFTFQGTIHEQLVPCTHACVDAGAGEKESRIPVPIRVLHHGYIPQVQDKKGTFIRNVSMLEKELEKNPDDTYYLYQIGKSYFNFDRDLNKACEYFERVLSICDDVRLEYFYNTVECYGYALINTGKYREALNLIEVYSKHYNRKPEFRFLTAHIYQNNGMFIEAVESYESCIGADMFDPKGITSYLSYYNIGVILECINMIDEAVRMYQNCGDYEPAQKRLAELKNSG